MWLMISNLGPDGQTLFLQRTTLNTCETCRRLAMKATVESLRLPKKVRRGSLIARLASAFLESMGSEPFLSENLAIMSPPFVTSNEKTDDLSASHPVTLDRKSTRL